MAHNQFILLERLIKQLSHENVDFYVHIDKKSLFNPEQYDFTGENVFFVDSVDVHWGSYSQIQAEMMLLSAAIKNEYDFYHLLTGVDTPLKPIEEILNFFENNSNYNFISSEPCWAMERVKYNYYFVGKFKRNSIVGRILEKISLTYQKLSGENRIKYDSYAIGSAYFDIKHDFACYLISKNDEIEEVFSNTFCADEIFIQTLYNEYLKNNPESKRYIYAGELDETLHRQSADVLRAIDWKRGKPYVFDDNDFNLLVSSGMLFCRKIDSTKSNELLKKLDEYLMMY